MSYHTRCVPMPTGVPRIMFLKCDSAIGLTAVRDCWGCGGFLRVSGEQDSSSSKHRGYKCLRASAERRRRSRSDRPRARCLQL